MTPGQGDCQGLLRNVSVTLPLLYFTFPCIFGPISIRGEHRKRSLLKDGRRRGRVALIFPDSVVVEPNLGQLGTPFV